MTGKARESGLFFVGEATLRPSVNGHRFLPSGGHRISPLGNSTRAERDAGRARTRDRRRHQRRTVGRADALEVAENVTEWSCRDRPPGFRQRLRSCCRRRCWSFEPEPIVRSWRAARTRRSRGGSPPATGRAATTAAAGPGSSTHFGGWPSRPAPRRPIRGAPGSTARRRARRPAEPPARHSRTFATDSGLGRAEDCPPWISN